MTITMHFLLLSKKLFKQGKSIYIYIRLFKEKKYVQRIVKDMLYFLYHFKIFLDCRDFSSISIVLETLYINTFISSLEI